MKQWLRARWAEPRGRGLIVLVGGVLAFIVATTPMIWIDDPYPLWVHAMFGAAFGLVNVGVASFVERVRQNELDDEQARRDMESAIRRFERGE